MASLVGAILKSAKELYDDVEANEIDMINLKVMLNGIIEGIMSYQDLSLEGNTQVILSVELAIKGSKNAIKLVRENQHRGAFYKYMYGTRDRRYILDAIEVLQLSL